MSSRVSDRLLELRRRRFVGRAAERSLFESVLASPQLRWQVLYIFGPGGVGKTTLLREFAYMCDRAETPAVYLDARNIEPLPEAFSSTLQSATGVTTQDSLFDKISASDGHYVIFIDTYETLAKLEDWLWEMFLPQLPENALVVLAGRTPPSKSWRNDPGWQALTCTIELGNLSPEESRTYLTKRQIPAEQHKPVLLFTHGHPLALSLVADVFAQHGDIHFQPEAVPDVVKTLLEQFLQEVPSPLHRTALEVCALVQLTTEPVLAETLAIPDACELFNWLRGLGFIESGPQGIFPHDLAREVLAADLRWRNLKKYTELYCRIRIYRCNRIMQSQGAELERALLEYLFDSARVRSYFAQANSQQLGK